MAQSNESFYVAPPEPPPSRRPPITKIGPIGQFQASLRGGRPAQIQLARNIILTAIAAAFIMAFLWSSLSWVIRDAQWGVVYNNLRLLNAGTYEREELWRVELVSALLVSLIGLSLGIWGRVARGVFWAVLIVLAIVIIVPLIGSQIPEPDIYLLMRPDRSPDSFVFVGLEGDEVTVQYDPLTSADDVDTPLVGYIEQSSRTEWSTQARQVREGELNLEEYNLHTDIRVLNRRQRAVMDENGDPLRFSFAGDPAGGSFSFTLPADDWYILEITRDDEVNEENRGYAWIIIDGVEIFSGQVSDTQRRIEEFGEPPDIEDAQLARESDYRFVGARTLGEFISLQLSPFFRRIALTLAVGALLFGNGWLVGMLGKGERRVKRAAMLGWVLVFPVTWLLLEGIEGSRTLPQISPANWGGLVLTLLLTVVGISASFPLGVALALGRRSDLPVIRWTCTFFIETLRGVPLITILFMAKLIVPFFWSALSDLDLVLRMMIGLTLFSAAYVAEIVRGGLQIVPHGQVEAARALGLNPLLTTNFIVLPQALRAVIPAIVGQFISLFKDTSLVALLGLFELVGMVDTIVSGQTIYRPYQREVYIYIALIYFAISFAMSEFSRRLEASGAGSVRRLA